MDTELVLTQPHLVIHLLTSGLHQVSCRIHMNINWLMQYLHLTCIFNFLGWDNSPSLERLLVSSQVKTKKEQLVAFEMEPDNWHALLWKWLKWEINWENT